MTVTLAFLVLFAFALWYGLTLMAAERIARYRRKRVAGRGVKQALPTLQEEITQLERELGIN